MIKMVNPKWYCKRCKKWHDGYPPNNCSKGYEEQKERPLLFNVGWNA